MTNLEIAWLAGLLEGEGSFGIRPFSKANPSRLHVCIQLSMTDEDVVRRAAALMENSPVFKLKSQPNRKQPWAVCPSGPKALRIMRAVLPFMGERRSAKIRECIELWGDRKTRQLRERGAKPICHPDAPHAGNGMCKTCYRRHQYLTVDLPARRAAGMKAANYTSRRTMTAEQKAEIAELASRISMSVGAAGASMGAIP